MRIKFNEFLNQLDTQGRCPSPTDNCDVCYIATCMLSSCDSSSPLADFEPYAYTDPDGRNSASWCHRARRALT